MKENGNRKESRAGWCWCVMIFHLPFLKSPFQPFCDSQTGNSASLRVMFCLDPEPKTWR